MKINSDYYEKNLKINNEDINIIFLYGPNTGLVDLLHKKTLQINEIDTNDPFNVSKIDGNELKDNPSILNDSICTINIFSDKRFIFLDLTHISVTKNLIG